MKFIILLFCCVLICASYGTPVTNTVVVDPTTMTGTATTTTDTTDAPPAFNETVWKDWKKTFFAMTKAQMLKKLNEQVGLGLIPDTIPPFAMVGKTTTTGN